VRIADVAIGQSADVNQTAVRQTNIDEYAEVDHVEHGRLQFHAWLQVFKLRDAAAEQRRRETFARIETRPRERIQNIAKQVSTDVQLGRELLNNDLCSEFSNPILHWLRRHGFSSRAGGRLLL
jgi:hypothetical protein